VISESLVIPEDTKFRNEASIKVPARRSARRMLSKSLPRAKVKHQQKPQSIGGLFNSANLPQLDFADQNASMTFFGQKLRFISGSEGCQVSTVDSGRSSDASSRINDDGAVMGPSTGKQSITIEVRPPQQRSSGRHREDFSVGYSI
jgi:hypothetical protein